MTAENRGSDFTCRGRGRGFNEAAADDRGKRPPRSTGCARPGGFNEAAADDRGKRRAAPRVEGRRGGLQ